MHCSHNVKTQISATFKSYINTLTVHLTAYQLAFSVVGFFSDLSEVHKCLGGIQLALAAIGQKQAGYKINCCTT